jgi:hypothetical protein
MSFLINYSIDACLRVVVAHPAVRGQLMRQGVINRRLWHQVASNHQVGLDLERVMVWKSYFLVGQGLGARLNEDQVCLRYC